ncbi:TPA: hypothetical protein QH041_003122 [Legionella pneumophila]|nr:hypothetical protein [Legionella pneumophila]HCU5995196.1 hypothetical protein [Legionella pneumophila]HDS3856754.1 hypothetical protein [Legionella pneumophila]HDS3863231.1 hypothetical protein [Legionella pneumophila]
METAIEHNAPIGSLLRELIEKKSQRDGKTFTTYQLAKAINMPHSILVKLLHPDPTKRVNNPRIDTLIKIVNFFKSDGFAIKLDDFLYSNTEIDIHSIVIPSELTKKQVQVFSMDYEFKNLGFIDIKLPYHHQDLMAFISDEEIKPFFLPGSIFIIDKSLKQENENLVAARIENQGKIVIGKFLMEGSKSQVVPLDDPSKAIQLLPTMHYQILGVIVQVNAKT